MAVPVVLCAQCGSHQVDVNGWVSQQRCVFRCSACGHQATVSGFTVGRIWTKNEPALVRAAIEDVAMPIKVRA